MAASRVSLSASAWTTISGGMSSGELYALQNRTAFPIDVQEDASPADSKSSYRVFPGKSLTVRFDGTTFSAKSVSANATLDVLEAS